MRPKVVTTTTWLMAVLNILGYALLWDVRGPKSAIIGVAVIFTFLIAIGYVVLWFFWRGHNWAGILVLLTSLLCLYDLRSFSGANLIVKVMLIGGAAVAVFLLSWLNTKPAKLYFGR